jgi:hypothetical protein
MTTPIGSTTDDILVTWERSTARPVPPFVVPAGRRWRSTGVLLLTAVLVALVAGALVVGPLTSTRPVQPTLEAVLASLVRAEALGFDIRSEVSHPEGLEGLIAEGVAVPPRRALTAAGRSLRPDGEWPFGHDGNGALVFVDERLFVRHGAGPWDEIESDPRGEDNATEGLPRLRDPERLASAILTAVAASGGASDDEVACGDKRCTRYDVSLDRATMHALVEAATGLQIDEPGPAVGPLVTTFLVDPDAGIVSVDGGFTEGDGTVRMHSASGRSRPRPRSSRRPHSDRPEAGPIIVLRPT